MNDIQIALTTVSLALAAGLLWSRGSKPAPVRIRRIRRGSSRRPLKR